ncbi:MAG: sodium-dependent transporter [DPANN group archaeon]|nr:sodium-dependent transporter [DPANN group archaeon]
MEQRARWSSRMIFLFAAIGSAVGLGNVWRFPYLAYKYGGGAFLVPYLIALFILGVPLLILEFALGQKLQKGAVAAFRSIHHRLGGIGTMAIFSGFVVVVYYAAVMAWALVFFFNSFQAKMPWAGDAKGYFFDHILHISGSVGDVGGINWTLFAALLVVWVLIYLSVRKGVKSVGKVVLVTMPLPIILLLVIFIRGITLDGALSGILFYITPDFSALMSTEIWLAAASQIFFTLSLGFGVMIAYASFNRKDQNITGDAWITALTNSGISLFAGFVVFSVLGYMATTTGVSVGDVVTSGPGLAFVVFPQALALMPLSWLFSALFFLTLLSLGIDSAFSLVEAVDTVIKDRFRDMSTKKIAFGVCLTAFVFGTLFVTHAGLYFLDIVDHFVTNFGLVLVGLFEAIAVGWVYGARRLREYINSVSRWKMGAWWDHLIRYVIPAVLILLLVMQFIKEMEGPYEGYPGWALAIGWSVVVVPLAYGLFVALSRKRLQPQ